MAELSNLSTLIKHVEITEDMKGMWSLRSWRLPIQSSVTVQRLLRLSFHL